MVFCVCELEVVEKGSRLSKLTWEQLFKWQAENDVLPVCHCTMLVIITTMEPNGIVLS